MESKIDKLSLSMDTMYSELGIKTGRRISLQLNQIEQTVIQLNNTIGFSSKQKITQRLSQLENTLYETRKCLLYILDSIEYFKSRAVKRDELQNSLKERTANKYNRFTVQQNIRRELIPE